MADDIFFVVQFGISTIVARLAEFELEFGGAVPRVNFTLQHCEA
jgi:hypothetical protein